MTRRFGIDTSILVRLLTGEPVAEFERYMDELNALVENEGAEILASNGFRCGIPCNGPD